MHKDTDAVTLRVITTNQSVWRDEMLNLLKSLLLLLFEVAHYPAQQSVVFVAPTIPRKIRDRFALTILYCCFYICSASVVKI